ncbi:MAG: class I SAM-dependent methyltransferase [Candidatus Eremiobacteraeota bacterium]|nr:class I SAM-dependent methyltransferase [Candidatus Eremiobacteraeota bacterium]MCW5867992.1 class I SAM-dependent methyltransferase [Candidatus Eremiobacteraeota bacterium]
MSGEHLGRVYAAKSPQELLQVYEEWAVHYERDLVEGMGWDKPAKVGQTLLPYLSEQARILDVGAGTGLMGDFLHRHGQSNLSALDFSPEMLQQAKKRGVYRYFYQHNLLEPVPLEKNHYDAITAVGILTEGHLGPEILPTLKTLLKPNGLLAFSLRDDLEHLYQEALQDWRLETQQRFSDGLEARPWSAWVYRA